MSSGLAPWACVCVYARVLVPPNLYIHTMFTYIHRCYSARGHNMRALTLPDY